MALTVVHSHVSVDAEAGNGEVGKTEWNANHGVTGTLDLANGGVGTDISGYSGLIKINGAAASQLTTTSFGEAILAGASYAAIRQILDLEVDVDVLAFAAAASQVEAEAGAETALRTWSPLRVAQAAVAAVPGGDMPIVQLRSTAAQSADSTSDIAVQWNQSDEKDTGFTHSTVTNNSRIEVDETGNYDLKGTVIYTGTTSNYRFTAQISIRINGSTVLSPIFQGGYIRATSGADNNQVPFALNLNLTAGDYVEILSKRISTTSGNATIVSGSNVSMTRLKGLKGDPGGTGADGDATIGVNAQTGTAYTLALSDAGDGVTMDNAAANTATIPTNASVAFPVGSVVNIVQKGAGVTTIAGAVGVTVNGVSGGSAAINTRYNGVSAWKIGTNEWIVSGDIGTVS